MGIKHDYAEGDSAEKQALFRWARYAKEKKEMHIFLNVKLDEQFSCFFFN